MVRLLDLQAKTAMDGCLRLGNDDILRYTAHCHGHLTTSYKGE